MIMPVIIFPATLYFCKILKQNISDIGITKKNFTESCVLGIIVALVLLFIFGIHRRYNDSYIAIVRFIYYLVCVSAVEEIVYRGLIRKNICKNKMQLIF